ncbi:MAG: RHS repeat-associated core domain-containing protein [Dysgonomonas sp.]|nr:RHS repeat-associated core domain-containing protein [Dysgonomonas sp.]
MSLLAAPMMGIGTMASSAPKIETADYVTNKVYENGALKRILIEGGFIDGGTYYFYAANHLGNNHIVANASGAVIQMNHYYPFGTAFAETSKKKQDKQSYKYNGKELDQKLGLKLYDYYARQMDGAIGRFMSVDPLAEKYYSWSPYVYVGNNPLLITDPTGMDWYQDSDGTYQYHKALNNENKEAFMLIMKAINGSNVAYIGISHQVKDDSGNVMEDYRKDGSIMYTNETDALNRIVNNSQKTGKEEFAAIFNNGALVLPSWQNEKTLSRYKEYGYDFKDGQLLDPVSHKSFNTIATAHTHPKGGNMTGDVGFARIKTPIRPMYAFMLGGETRGNVSYILHSGEQGNYAYRNTINHPNLTVSNILSGNLNIKSFGQNIINKHMRTGKFNPWP